MLPNQAQTPSVAGEPQAPPGYRIVRRIGQGGMGEVYLAVQTDSDRQVAMKFRRYDTMATQEMSSIRFARESALHGQLRHPNIVAVYDGGTLDDCEYFVMEYIEGRSLRECMVPGKPLGVSLTRSLVRSVTDALSYLHQREVIHRDLKPENVLIDQQGTIKLADFGIAAYRAEIGQLTATGAWLGTPNYMAPEQRHRLPMDERADQFSFAVVLYEALTGRCPLGSFKAPSQVNGRLSRQVDSVLTRALQQDPDDRFGTVQEFADALEIALNSPGLVKMVSAGAAMTGGGALALALVAWTDGTWIPSQLLHLGSPPSTATRSTGETANQTSPVAVSGSFQPEAKHTTADFVRIADQHEKDGRNHEAIRNYTRAIAMSPQDAAIRMARAHVLWKVMLHEEALADLEEAKRLAPEFVGPRTQIGLIRIQHGEYQAAKGILDEEIRLHPQAAEAYAHRGRAQHRLGDLDAALDDLNRAIAIDSHCGEAFHFRALVFQDRRLGRYGEALADFKASVQCTPDNPFAYALLASFLCTCPQRQFRDGPAALRHATRACELSDWKEPQSLRALAAAHAETENLAEAIQWCERALDCAPLQEQKSLQKQRDAYKARLAALSKPGEVLPP